MKLTAKAQESKAIVSMITKMHSKKHSPENEIK